MGVNVLVIGKTPVLTYLTYVLHKVGWNITVCDPHHFSRQWSITFPSASVSFEADTICSDFDGLSPSFDVVIFSHLFSCRLGDNLDFFLSLIHEKTTILLDCGDSPWKFDVVSKILPDHLVFAVVSSLDCKRVSGSSNSFIVVKNAEDLAIRIGVLSRVPVATRAFLKRKLATVLNSLKKASSEVIIHIVPYAGVKFLQRLAWKCVISTVVLCPLTVLFEEYQLVNLAAKAHVSPLMKNCYNEVLSIGKQLGVGAFPISKPEISEKLLQLLILVEGNKTLWIRSRIKDNYSFLDSNHLYYDFCNGYDLSILGIMNDLLEIAAGLEIPAPYLQCMYSYLRQLLDVRDSGQSAFFHVKKNLTKYSVVKDISPKKNMMNFPPFNPLPIPTTITKPIIMMYDKTTIALPGDTDSFITVDSKLQELISDIPVEYNTPPTLPPQPCSNPQSPPAIAANTAPTGLPGPYQGPLPAPVGQQGYIVPPQPTYQYMGINKDPNMAYYPPTGIPNQESLKSSPFHHLQPIITKNTPVTQLKQSLNTMLRQTKFEDTFGTQSSRYGKYDTATAFVKSANNSRGSRASYGDDLRNGKK